MALNRLLIASHLHLFFTLSVVVSFPNMETLCQIWKCSFSPDLSALIQFGANFIKLFLLFYLSSY